MLNTLELMVYQRDTVLAAAYEIYSDTIAMSRGAINQSADPEAENVSLSEGGGAGGGGDARRNRLRNSRFSARADDGSYPSTPSSLGAASMPSSHLLSGDNSSDAGGSRAAGRGGSHDRWTGLSVLGESVAWTEFW